MAEVTRGNDLESPEPEDGHALPHERDWPRPWQGPFLRSLSLIPDVSSACRVARISRKTAYKWRGELSPEFRDAWDEALELARDLVQRTAHQWATAGVPVKRVVKKTTTKRNPDSGEMEIVATEIVETEAAERSATLMIFWLKAFYPDRFRFAERVESTGADGGPIRVESIDALDAQIEKLAAEIRARDAGLVPEAEVEG